MTTLLVFLPVVFIPGVTGALFRDLALTVSCLLLASLVCALTLTPALYRLFLEKNASRGSGGSRIVDKVSSIYSRYLHRELLRPRGAPALLIILLLAGLLAAVALPKRILPETEIRKLDIHADFAAAAPLELGRSVSREIAEQLLAVEGIDSVFASAGYDRGSLVDRADPQKDPRRVHFQLALAPRVARSPQRIIGEIGQILEGFPDIQYTITRCMDDLRLLLGDSDEVAVRLSGEDRQSLVDAAGSIVEQLREEKLIGAASIDTRRDADRIEFRLDPDRTASHNAEAAVVLQSLRTALRGHIGTQLPSSGIRSDIRVRLDPGQTATQAQLEKIRILTGEELIEAGTLGRFRHSRAYEQLHRFNRSPAVSLTVHPLPGARKRVVEFLSTDRTHRGEVLAVSALRRNQRHILLVFAFALLLMYLLVGAQFESFILPLLLLLSLVPALSGSLIVLLLCGYSLNINSFLGILILAGTAINISIILTAAFEPGMPISRERLVSVCRSRLKPIVATVLSTVVAMIPIAVNVRGEAALQSHTAVALIGGLLIGMVSILLVFPALYDRLAGASRCKT
jgi:HAE1 family hydrophobic/amphiphilic exporter-1